MASATPMSMARELRQRLAGRGAPVIATFVKLPTTDTVELVARAGFDVAIIDLEHSQLSEREARRLVTHAVAIGFPALVRIPATDAAAINRILEAGAVGVQLSMVRRRVQIDELCSACAYPPNGTRSINLAHVAGAFGVTAMNDYLASMADDGPILVGQIETATTVDPLDDIVTGLDVAFGGTTDLSISLGEPGQLDGPAVRRRLSEIADSAGRAGVTWGAFTGTPEGARRLLAEGARYVALGADLGVLGAGLRTARSSIERSEAD